MRCRRTVSVCTLKARKARTLRLLCAYLNAYIQLPGGAKQTHSGGISGSDFFSHDNPIPEASVDERPNHFVRVKVVWESEHDLAGFI
jgi:hypothetical protein